jgi:hypothetical protein
MLLVCFGLAVILAGYFALGRPRVWYKDRLGWVLFGYALTTVSFVGLIAYAIVFQQKVDEPVRLGVSTLMAFALTAKIFAVYSERREARLGTNKFPDPEENPHEHPHH